MNVFRINNVVRRESSAAGTMLLLLLSFCFLPLSPLTPSLQAGEIPVEQAQRLNAMKKLGGEASLTIAPINLSGQAIAKVSEVVGVLLERAGMANLVISDKAFLPEKELAFTGVVNSFGEFVRSNPITTDYILYGEFMGSSSTGVEEIRGILLDKSGNVVWTDQQTPEDDAFKAEKPENPMTCSVFLAQRVSTALDLKDPMREDAPEGKLAKKLARDAGVPSRDEFKAIGERLNALKELKDPLALIVYPVQILSTFSAEHAASLAKMITSEGLFKATASDENPDLDFKRTMNQQQVLFGQARGFKEWLKQHPHKDAYAMYIYYMYRKTETPPVMAVHFILVDPADEWVITDLQNSHHDDFQAINPTTEDGCDKLVIKRLKSYLE